MSSGPREVIREPREPGQTYDEPGSQPGQPVGYPTGPERRRKQGPDAPKQPVGTPEDV